MVQFSFLLPLLSLFHLLFISGVFSATFTIKNNCGQTVWPGVLANAGNPPLSTTGFALQSGESKSLSAPLSWAGRIWGRTLCTEFSTHNFSCVTADCGSGTLECAGRGAEPPTTLVEFALNGADGLDFYDVSLVDGYNLPILVVAQDVTRGNCSSTGCLVDLNRVCPSELKVSSEVDGSDVACKSACEAFQQPQFCCSGEYANPNTCKPSSYSEFFKQACPRAYSYAFDDPTSTFTCAAANYVITFCPPVSARQKSSEYPEAASMDEQDASSAHVAYGQVLLAVVVEVLTSLLWAEFHFR